MEPVDMSSAPSDQAIVEEPSASVRTTKHRTPARRSRITPKRTTGHSMRCVSSGYLSHGCSCQSAIPADVVLAAWARERRTGREDDHFFHFAWREGIWLGYGLASGRVRGVYCPEHRSVREEHSFTHADAPVGQFDVAHAAA
jgi:hypothetical protein